MRSFCHLLWTSYTKENLYSFKFLFPIRILHEYMGLDAISENQHNVNGLSISKKILVSAKFGVFTATAVSSLQGDSKDSVRTCRKSCAKKRMNHISQNLSSRMLGKFDYLVNINVQTSRKYFLPIRSKLFKTFWNWKKAHLKSYLFYLHHDVRL